MFFSSLMTYQGEEPDLPGARFILFVSAVLTIDAPLTLNFTFGLRGCCYMVDLRQLSAIQGAFSDFMF